MTHTYDMVCLAGTDVGDPVSVDAEELQLFMEWTALLIPAYVSDGMPVSVEITPRAQNGACDG
jgi:hypothetical protein